MNKSYSLHKIQSQENCPFSEAEYSEFKFGNNAHSKKFAKELFAGFLREHRDLLLETEEIVILPSPYFLTIIKSSN